MEAFVLYVVSLVMISVSLGMELRAAEPSMVLILWHAFLGIILFLCVCLHVMQHRDSVGENIWW
jgi:hypothetical protein